MSNENKSPEQTILKGAEGFREVTSGVYIIPAQGNALAIETDESFVIIDSGPGGKASRRMIESVRSVSNKPISIICYSHGHLGYNDGIDEWLAHNAEREEPAPLLAAHENLVTRYHRYRQTMGLQSILAGMQFPGAKLKNGIRDPDLVFSQRLSLPVKGRRIELLWVPSETDDCIAAWLPDDGLLYSGAAFPGTTIPNIGTPLRTQRLTIRWAESCELMASLDAELLVQEFGPVIEGKQAVKNRLMKTAESLRWFREEVVKRMNLGMNEREILDDMTYPDYVNELEYMKARYGAPEYIVRDIYREENGWWDRNPTTLHPANLDAAGDAVLSALGDPEAVVARAEQLHAAGDIQLALHVIDLVANAGTTSEVVLKARRLKAELCRQRAKEVRPYVSKALYESSAQLLDEGQVSWKKID